MEKGFPEVTPAMIAARAAANGAQFSLNPSLQSPVPPAAEPPPTVLISARPRRRIVVPLLLLGLITCVAGGLGVAALVGQPGRAAKQARARVEAALPPPSVTPAAPLVVVHSVRPPTEQDKPFTYEDVPRIPEAYTGDPAGQALWEQTVEQDQQTLQPEDLEEGPPRVLPDLRQYSAYRAQNVDADGNLN
jgi:hypothetical protein